MTWSRGRLLLLAAGIGLIGVGVLVGLTSVPRRQWPELALWLAGGVAVHDAVLAPLAVLLGLAVLPRVEPHWRPALRAGALGAGVLAIFAVVILGGAGRRRNPSVLPVPPTTSLVVATAVLVVAVLVGAGVGALARPHVRPSDANLLPRDSE